MRYLAELPWAPHAMVSNRELEWRDSDATSAEVSTFIGGERVAVMLQLDLLGDITVASADARQRLVGKRSIPTPFRGVYGDYRVIGGLRLPTFVEVAWLLPAGPFTYFRARVTNLVLE